MRIQIARNAAKTRFRIQQESFPPWPGWDIREGTISQGDWKLVSTTSDDVELERIHQDVWARARPVLFPADAVPGERRNLS